MIKRILKWTFRFAVVALLILIAITTNSWYGYRQAQADFRARGYPTTMEELRAWDAVDDPAENAAIPIQEAMNKMTWEFPEDLQLPVSSDCCWRNDYYGTYPPEILADIKIMLDANQESLRILHDSRHLEKYRPKVTNGYIDFDRYRVHSSYRETARYLTEEAHYYTGVGQMDEAIDSIETTLWLSKMISQYPEIISALVAEAIRGIGFGTTREMIKKYEVTDLQLQRLLDINEPSLVNLYFQRNVLGDHVMTGDYFSLGKKLILLTDELSTDSFFEIVLNVETYKFVFTPLTTTYVSNQQFHAEGTQQYLTFIESEFFSSAEEGTLISGEPPFPPNHEFSVRESIDSLRKMKSFPFQHRARTTVLRAGLQIEQYRRRHGALPESLDDLVPEFTESIPMDAMTGEALHYTITDDGYEVYSLGQNLEDDHGSLDEEGDPIHEHVEFQRVLN